MPTGWELNPPAPPTALAVALTSTPLRIDLRAIMDVALPPLPPVPSIDVPPPLPPKLRNVPFRELAALSVTISVEVALPPLAEMPGPPKRLPLNPPLPPYALCERVSAPFVDPLTTLLRVTEPPAPLLF